MNTYYVYCYKHPISLKPFYVGKGSKDRSTFHLKLISANIHKNKYFSNTVKQLISQNLEPLIEIVQDNLSEQEAYDLEAKLIEEFGRKLFDKDGILCNLSKGGIGPVGYKHSEETKKKMKLLKQSISKETRKRMSNSHKGKTQSKETIEKRASKMRGTSRDSTNMHKPKSLSHKEAISAARSGEKCPRAKSWLVISPTGEKFIIKSLKTFCETHGLAITSMQMSVMRKSPVSKGISKGWQVFHHPLEDHDQPC